MFDYGHFANHEPSDGVDGNLETAWLANDNLPHWLQIDLGQPTDINSIGIIFWQKGRHRYRIQTSSNGRKWKTITETEIPEVAETVRLNRAASGVRFVRVWHLGSASGYNWTGIRELAVYAGDKNIATGKPATSDNFQVRTDAAKAVDGDFATAWTIDNDQFPQSLTVDLGARCLSVALALYGKRLALPIPTKSNLREMALFGTPLSTGRPIFPILQTSLNPNIVSRLKPFAIFVLPSPVMMIRAANGIVICALGPVSANLRFLNKRLHERT